MSIYLSIYAGNKLVVENKLSESPSRCPGPYKYEHLEMCSAYPELNCFAFTPVKCVSMLMLINNLSQTGVYFYWYKSLSVYLPFRLGT